jgi:predicted CoA-substrate-specific enzyme activase
MGVDVGSVSVNIVLIDLDGEVVYERYVRHKGRPMQEAAGAIREALAESGVQRVLSLATTGSGGRPVADALGGTQVNEVIAQAEATGRLVPEVRTVIEIGGEDSKLIFLKLGSGGTVIADFAMNTMCAAGTGSFLDQQASRLGLSIEEFGQLALTSASPPRVAGRCSVFAKSDMIHLQQKATPTQDIVAGLCFALVRNFKSTVGSAAELEPPISFQGGVAANEGIIRAMRDVLALSEDELMVPEHFASMGAIGAVYRAMEEASEEPNFDGLAALAGEAPERAGPALQPLKLEQSCIKESRVYVPPELEEKIPAYLGVDVGSLSTNVVVLDAQKRVLAKRYLPTAGRPLEAVGRGLLEVGEEVGERVEILGACTTGSGRYLTGDFIGADVVRNEITAQARAAIEIDPTVDTIFEIGGQDSKYISLDSRAVVDFEMNKVCAAGTGSFLEEQAEKLGINIAEEFGELALSSQAPVSLGERCTVFMESELVKHQQAGAPRDDLVAGLAYSIVYNYLNRVVARKRVGDNIFFQGGVAFNRGVVAAFEQVTGKPITVPEHHEVTGAIGCALIAMEQAPEGESAFKGFDRSDVEYRITSFECRDCPNRCEINRVKIEREKALYYGSRCEKFDVDRQQADDGEIPDLFKEREQMLLGSAPSGGTTPGGTGSSLPVASDDRTTAPKIGMPRALLHHELFPLWRAAFEELGCDIVLSDPTNKRIIHQGAEQSVAETCFPMKVGLGHVLDLVDRDIDFIFLPSVINFPLRDERLTDSFVCPYVQSFCYTVQSSVDFSAHGVEVLAPVMYLQHGTDHLVDALGPMAERLGKGRGDLRRAVAAGQAALEGFEQAALRRGQQVLARLTDDERVIVIVSRPYNGCDAGANLDIPRKLRNMGVLAMPLDFLPVEQVELPDSWENMYWHYGARIIAASELIAEDDRLHAIYLTNFGCGPDSFLHKYFRERLGSKPCLVIEVDEHSADAGMITRCEAFLDSLEATREREFAAGRVFEPLSINTSSRRTVMIPNMSAHAFALAAAFECSGMPAEVLPEPDEETLLWGRQYTSGKECFPCIVTTGDMVKFTKRPEFDRDRHAFFMGGSGGPCRFGQYNALQRMVLDEIGYDDVPLYAPNQASSFYNDIGIIGRKFLRQAWRGIVAVDMIEKAIREMQPYEVEPGAAARAHETSLAEICDAIRSDDDLEAAVQRAADRFAAVEVDRTEPRPIIGLVGEFYVRANRFSNQDVIAKIEALGGEVWMAPIFEWFLYRNFRRGMRWRLSGEHGQRAKNWLRDHFQKRDEHALAAPFHDLLRNATEPSSVEVLDYAAPYLHYSFEGEAIMTVGKAVDFVRKGLSGVIAVMPFTCMPGTISEALLKRVREQEGGFPFLNMVYDGLEQSTAETRIEAFMHQARAYMESRRQPVPH